MKILIDNGHGENTKGKRSPDGLLREYSYTRDIAAAVERELRTRGYDVERIVRESIDVSLSERARRVNEWCGRLGASKVLLVSIHVNAAGSGEEWMSARGWSAYTHKGKSKSDRLANALYAAAEKNFPGRPIRRDMQDGDPDWEENYYILTKTKCAAVLTENFFMDNEKDMQYLQSSDGFNAVVRTHVDGIINYIGEVSV